MNKMIAAFAALMVVSCSAGSDEKIGTSTQELHAWSTYHWDKAGDQVQLNLASNLSGGWLPYLNEASADWNVSTVVETTVIQGSQSSRKCKPVLGRVEVCNSTYGRNGWLGIAQVWISNGHIVQAVVKLNDTYFNMPTYNNAPYKRLVMCQEIAHTFGLDHQDENQTNTNLGTCMDYTNNPSGPPSNEHPNAHDYEELEAIYSHDDSPSTASQTDRAEHVITHVLPAQDR